MIANDVVASVIEVGTIPDPPGSSGRDVGFSQLFAGRSVWVFGDTFFARTAADGYHWRASTWSYTSQLDASHGLGGWTHAVGPCGDPLQLVPHTAGEQSFDDAHNGTPCAAGSSCGARETAWPGAFVVDPTTGQALIFYTKEDTQPTGAFSFTTVGASIATWASPDVAAVRPVVAPGQADPTVLFPADEPPWGSAALVVGDRLYAYACPGGGLTTPCRLARVPLANALTRSAWTFFDGKSWVSDWHAATNLFDGAPLFTVTFNPYLHRYLAIYMVPLGNDMALREADAPEGPWSNEVRFATGAVPANGWDYALAAHPELEQDGGRIEYLSYYQPGTFLNGVVRLVQLTFR